MDGRIIFAIAARRKPLNILTIKYLLRCGNGYIADIQERELRGGNENISVHTISEIGYLLQRYLREIARQLTLIYLKQALCPLKDISRFALMQIHLILN